MRTLESGQEVHWPGLIAVILCSLYPKVMNRSGIFSGKVRHPSNCVLYLLGFSRISKNDCIHLLILVVIS
jgi:hypothetical protein